MTSVSFVALSSVQITSRRSVVTGLCCVRGVAGPSLDWSCLLFFLSANTPLPALRLL